MNCICDGEFNEDCEYCNKLGMEGEETMNCKICEKREMHEPFNICKTCALSVIYHWQRLEEDE